MKLKFTSLLFFVALGLFAQERKIFNEDWKFALNIKEDASLKEFDDANWRVLDLPHDWSIEGEYDKNNPSAVFGGYLPGGIGWYRKTISIPENWKNKNVEIVFDAVFRNSTVWANGVKLGLRPYGYVSFSYDVSEIVNNSDSITFVVKVDCEKQPAARWYTGAGIYANTYIDVKNKIHIPRDGVFVRTEGANVLVDVDVLNQTSKKTQVYLVSSVVDASGKVLASEKTNLVLKAGEKIMSEHQLIKLENPRLWSPETPNLYTLVTEIKSENEIFDRLETKFGVRDVKWVPETGMWLNGKNVKLRGVCNHQSAGAMGAAVPDKILRFRIQQLKDMGVNAIRTAHNAQTPSFYGMCDEMGMMVMDEFFDGWSKKAEHDYGAHDFADWWERDLTSLVKRDRNHPSIVLYSVGNETKGDYGKALVALCHKYDNSRLVTSGHAGPDDMDVFGENGGSEKKGFFETLEKDRPFIGTENVHTWHTRGFYRTKMWYRDGFRGKSGKADELYFYPDLTEKEIFTYDWTNGTERTNGRQTLRSSYDNSVIGLTVRHNIQKLRDIPNFSGTFRWSGYDYLGEVKYHGGWPFKSFSGGAMDLANFEKDLFYLYQSQWTTEPMVHVLPHWTHPTLKIGTEIPVWVYSNCDEVELFFNGKSLGKQKPGIEHSDMQCDWMVPWNPGEIKAVGYKNGKEIIHETIRTSNAPSQIKLSVDGKPLLNQKNDIVQIRVTSTDEKGEMYPYGENRTYFQVIGSGKVRALDNGSPLDKERYYEAKSRIGFFGLTRAYIESTDVNGDINLFAGCILGEKKLISSNKVSIDTKFINLRGKDIYNKSVEVFYTTDGSTPTSNSKLYTKPFDIQKGITVKALVLLNGDKVFVMEERFADDVGFYWDTVVKATELGGDQAEDAKYKIAVVSNEGKNYKGTGFLEFGTDSNETGFVEWYYENDRNDGEFTLKLAYSGSSKTEMQKIILSVNDVQQEVALQSTTKYKTEWNVFETKVKLNAGANYIRVTAKDVTGLSIDELIVE